MERIGKRIGVLLARYVSDSVPLKKERKMGRQRLTRNPAKNIAIVAGAIFVLLVLFFLNPFGFKTKEARLAESVPQYPNSMFVRTSRTGFPDDTYSAIRYYKTTDEPAQVLDYYENSDELERSGWEFKNRDEILRYGEEKEGDIFFVKDNKWQLHISVQNYGYTYYDEESDDYKISLSVQKGGTYVQPLTAE